MTMREANWEALARKAGWEVQGRVFVQEGKQAWADPEQPDAWANLCEEMGIEPLSAHLVCSDCGESVTGDEKTTWQQWQCTCCGSWHDRVK